MGPTIKRKRGLEADDGARAREKKPKRQKQSGSKAHDSDEAKGKPLTSDGKDEPTRQPKSEDPAPPLFPEEQRHIAKSEGTQLSRNPRTPGSRKDRFEKRQRERESKSHGQLATEPTPLLNEGSVKNEGSRADGLLASEELAVTPQRHDGEPNSKLNNGDEEPSPSAGVAWSVSQSMGGRQIDADPVFSNDEKFLFLAHPSTINVYSTESSSLIRSLPVVSSGSVDAQITAFILCPAKTSHLYTATSLGIVYLFDWREGSKLGRWKPGATVRELAISSDAGHTDEEEDIVYAREQTADKWRISAYKLRSGAAAAKTESKTLISLTHPITHFKLAHGGKAIVTASQQRLLVGVTAADPASSLKELKYTWREVVVPAHITCIDVHVDDDDGQRAGWKLNKAQSRSKATEHTLDVVIGDEGGRIYVHEDLLNQLVRQEREPKKPQAVPRRMHWHREAVSSVKWSRDGNYVISGGSETVLVLWQLDTNRNQFLPHLSAAILSIVVSPSGTGYAIRLSDNSTMVLSTSELKPKAYVGGIQAQVVLRRAEAEQQKAGEKDPIPSTAKANQDAYLSAPLDVPVPVVPAAISCMKPTHLLLAVPSSPFSNTANTAVACGTPYLQTVDLTTAHHVARQALARTNATTVNIGPEENKLVEPSVILMRVSHEGGWLAAVDEWSPPVQDLELFSRSGEQLQQERSRRREVHLKFWKWNAASRLWELVTRVDKPHRFEDSAGAAARVLDLQADPTQTAFASIGEDCAVRIWASRARRRNNLVLRGENGEPLVEWRCLHVIPLRRSTPQPGGGLLQHRLLEGKEGRRGGGRKRGGEALPEDAAGQLARLAYSADGSVLAVAQSGPEQEEEGCGLVYFIDPSTASIRRVQTGLYSGAIVGLGFVERYLVALAGTLTVWNTVLDRLSYRLALQPTGVMLTRAQKAGLMHLAVDDERGTFAVALPVFSAGAGAGAGDTHGHGGQGEQAAQRLTSSMLESARSQVFIFGPKQAAPLHVLPLLRITTALVPLTDNAAGYVILDGSAEMRTISHPLADAGPDSSSTSLALAALPASPEAMAGARKAGEEDSGQLAGADSAIAVLAGGHPRSPRDEAGETFGWKVDVDGGVRSDAIVTAAITTANDDAATATTAITAPATDKVKLELDDDDDDQPPVVRQDQLTKIFDVGPAYTLPPVRELFEAVARLFSKKPLVPATAAGATAAMVAAGTATA